MNRSVICCCKCGCMDKFSYDWFDLCEQCDELAHSGDLHGFKPEDIVPEEVGIAKLRILKYLAK